MSPSIPDVRGRVRRFGAVALLTLAAAGLWVSTAMAQTRRSEPRETRGTSSASTTQIRPVAKAVVNFTELSRLEAMGLAPRPPVRPRVLEEEEERELNEMNEEPGADQIGPISLESIPPPPFIPFVASPSATNSFVGLDDIPMVDSSYIVIPPDVSGGVGPTRVMDGHNNNYRVQDKSTGATIVTVGTATFWNPVITNKALLNQLTDPRTLYDPIQNRWILAMQTVNNPGLILIGVSQTSDPAGSWFLYAFTLSGSYLIDFPNLGFNRNWICVSINRFTAGGAFSFGVQLVADYAAARAGTLSSASVFNGAAGTRFCAAPCATLSATEDTLFLVTHLASAAASYQVDRITGTPAAPVYTSGGTLTRPGGGWTQPAGNALPQSAPNAGASACGATPCPLETQDSQVRSAPIYRVDSTTGRGFIYYTQTIQLSGPTRIAAQWTKITASTTAAFADGGRIDDPTAAKWHAYPHVAVNSAGDMIVGYTQFGSTQHPSAGYSMRAATDAPGTLRDAVLYKAGEDYYHKTFSTTTGRNRWGDFSTAQVDPSDDKTLWAYQEYGKTRTGTDDGNTGSNSSRWSNFWAAVTTVSIDPGPTVAEGNAGTTNAVFTVRIPQTFPQNVVVNYQTSDGTATTTNSDYVAATSTATIPAGSLTGTLTVLVNGDAKRESNETLNVTLTGANNALVSGPNVATATITNDDAVPTLSINDISVTEGNAGTTNAIFTVSLSNQTDQTVTVQYVTADGTGTIANSDYATATGTVNIPAKTSSATLTVQVTGDTKFEASETFFVNLSNPNANATILDGQGQGTITNDDAVPVISINDVTVTEGNTGTVNAVFTVSLSNTTDQAVTVDFQTADGTGTLANADYQAASGTVTIPAKTSSATLTVLVNGDIKREGNDTFLVNLTNPVNATIADAQGVGTVNNDDAQPTISINDVNVVEGNTGTTAAVFTVSLSSQSDFAVAVTYQTADGTATLANSDYPVASGSLVIPPKTSSGTITVLVTGDTKREGNETFFVNLSNPGNGTIADGQGLGTIQNDDAIPSVSIADIVPTLEGNAGTTPFLFTVTLSNTSDQAVSVGYQTADGTATLANNDYQAASGTLTIPAKTASGTITVLVNGDTKFEGNETFVVNLSAPVNATLADPQGQATIQNDDTPPNLAIGDAKVVEGNAGTVNAVFTLTLSNTTDQTVTVDYHTVDVSATLANNDYADATGTATIAPKALATTVSVPVFGDTKFESDETFFVNLSNGANATITDAQAIGTISNDDNPPTLSINDVEVVEGNSGTVAAVLTVSLSNTTDQTVTVNWQTLDGSALASNSDYVTASGTLTIPAKTSAGTITVVVNGDLTAEGNELFAVDLSGAVHASIADGHADVTISNDDDQPAVTIGDVKVLEGNSGTVLASFTVGLTHANAASVTVNWQTRDGSATVANADYVAGSGIVTFPPKSTSPQSVSVVVNGDTKFEGDETFFVDIVSASGAYAGVSGVGTISNDDTAPTVSVNDVKVVEGNAGTIGAVFTIGLSNPTDQPVTVDYQTSDNSATLANADYQVAGGTVTIAPKALSTSVTVVVNGDSKFEGDETFSVDLSNPSNATLGDGHGVGTVSNDDTQPTVSIDDVKVVEGNAGTTDAVFTISLSNTTDQPVTVSVQTSDGSATLADNDYVAAGGSATIAPKTLSTTFTVLVNGDGTFEPSEFYSVDLSSAVNATIGDGHGVGTISDDDGGAAVSIDDVKVVEGNAGTTGAVFTISLSNATAQPVTVNVQTSDGSATLANSDYTAASGAATIAPKTLSTTVTVLVHGDTKFERDETFVVGLSAAVNATIADGQGVGTISNDDAQPALSIGDAKVTEGNAGTVTATFSVALSTSSGFPVTVHWATADGSATTANGDYLAASGDLTFGPKETKKTLDIAVNGDTKNEPNESFFVNLSAPLGATILDGQGEGTISNDDATVSQISIGDASGNEDSGPLTFSISLDQASGFPISVHYQTVNGSATTANNDYVAAGGDVTFAPKETKKTITVQLVADCAFEPDETFTVVLSAATGPSSILDRSSTGTIVNDDVAVGTVSNLAAMQQTTGNDGDGTTRIMITYTLTGSAPGGVEVWRAGFGSYPEYDDAGGSVPATPGSYPPGPPWVLTGVTASGQSDEVAWPNRDFYYYIAFAKDGCGGVSPVSNQTNGTLNYHLGDWHNGTVGGNCAGNNRVNTSDVSFLGAHYGLVLGHSSDPFACLDVGPTTTGAASGRPTTDDKVQFEDLVIMSINYGIVSLAPRTVPERTTGLSNQVKVIIPDIPDPDHEFEVRVEMTGAGDIHALTLLLGFDHDLIEQLSVRDGDLLGQQASESVVLSSEQGNVDVALLGTANGGIVGSGRLARMLFRVKAAGNPHIVVRHIEGRSSENQSIPIGVLSATTPTLARTALGSPAPNPFDRSTSFQISLATGGRVRLGIYDVQGRQVRRLIEGDLQPGQRVVTWDGLNDAGTSVRAGVYVIRMESGSAVLSRRVAIVR